MNVILASLLKSIVQILFKLITSKFKFQGFTTADTISEKI